MKVLARFTHDHVDFNESNTLPLVVTLKAPTLDWVEKRRPLCVLPVIDLSGSMSGGKLTFAKQSMLKLVEQLSDGDYAGLIGFESRVHLLVKPQVVTAEFKSALASAIRKLQPMGGTNLSAGLTETVKVIQALDLPPTFLKRAIVFTDGQPTEGHTDPALILKMLDTTRGSVTVSAFGYGDVKHAGCDQDFLLKLSDVGKGNYAYVQDPDAALAAFGKEFGGLISTYATDLRVQIEPMNGHQILKVLSDVGHETDPVTGAIDIRIPSVMCEEARHLVFDTQLLKQAKSFPRAASVFSVRLTYTTVTADGALEEKTVEEKARVHFSRTVSTETDKEVAQIAALHRVIRAQLEAEELAKKGQYEQASNLMKGVGVSVQLDSAVVAEAAFNLSSRLENEVLYTANRGYLRSFASGGTRGVGTSAMDADAQGVLIACAVPVSNSLQDQMVDAFAANPAIPPPVATNPPAAGYVARKPSKTR